MRSFFNADESVFGSEPPRWVKEVNCKERDSNSDHISNCDKTHIKEEDLQLKISTKYNLISFQPDCPSKVPSYGSQTITRTENDLITSGMLISINKMY